MKRRLLIIVIIAAGLLAVRMKRMRQKNAAPLLKSVPMTVQTAKVGRQTIASSRHVLGEVIGADEADIAPRIMARVVEVKVREGDTVTKGQLLVVLDGREQQDAVDAARDALEAARIAASAQHDATARDKILYEAKAISQEQWDHSRALEAALNAKLSAAKKNLKVAQTRLGYTRLTAPVDGVLAKRLVDPGDLAVPGKPVLKVVQQTSVRVRAKLPQEDLAHLQVGQPVTMTVGEDVLAAPVARVFPAADANHLATCEVDLPEPPVSFVAGATVSMDITINSAEGASVPLTALLEGESGTWVFKVVDGTVHPVPVTILSAGSESAVVSGEVQAGDQVVVARPSRLMMLSDGQQVRLAEQGGQS